MPKSGHRSTTLWVPSPEDGESDGVMGLVLAGDDNRVQQTTLGSILHRCRERNSERKLNYIHVESK